ncbi:MAG: hypothetical protein ACW98Y_10550 [Candidatus Thorarchaeota archaeon]|jgi:hypothetical protein
MSYSTVPEYGEEDGGFDCAHCWIILLLFITAYLLFRILIALGGTLF